MKKPQQKEYVITVYHFYLMLIFVDFADGT